MRPLCSHETGSPVRAGRVETGISTDEDNPRQATSHEVIDWPLPRISVSPARPADDLASGKFVIMRHRDVVMDTPGKEPCKHGFGRGLSLAARRACKGAVHGGKIRIADG